MTLDKVDAVSASLSAVSVCLEPVYNQLHSLMLLAKEERLPGLSDWVLRTREQMSLEERQRHRLVMWGLFYAFTAEANLESFGAYLEHLASLEAESFRDRMMTAYLCCRPGAPCAFVPTPEVSPMEWGTALESTEAYLSFLGQHFEASQIDADMESQAYRYVLDPPAMKRLIVDHLRSMWDKYLSAEWARVRPLVRDSVDAFRGLDLVRLPRLEAVRQVIGRDLPDQKWESIVDNAEKVVLVPNAHVGPYLGKLANATTLILVFGVRQPRDSREEAPDLSRSELLSQISALSDDNRLRILRMAADKGEIRAPDVMASLDLSQSAASRNLSQLTATGFLRERWRDGGKTYTLNTARLGDTVRAVTRYLRLPAAAGEGRSEDV